MAQFDLKNAVLKIKDGYTETGAVDNVAGYTIGATTMVVDSFGAAVALHNFDIFTITGQTTRYQITAHTETLGATTSITFTPALTAAAADGAVINVLGRELAIVIGEGTFTYSEKKTREYKKNRGVLDTVRDGDEEPVNVRFDFEWEFLKASTGLIATIEDALKQRGGASYWVSSSADECEPYAVDLELTYSPDCGSAEDEIITIADFRYEELNHDAKAGTVAVSGKANVTEASTARAA